MQIWKYANLKKCKFENIQFWKKENLEKGKFGKMEI